MKTIILLLSSLFSFTALAADPLEAPKIFEKDGYKYYSCEYSKDAVNIALYEVDTEFRALAPGLKPDICFGQIKCARQNIDTGKTSWAEFLMSCDANLGSTCPTAMECGSRGSKVAPMVNTAPQIQTRAAAYEGYVDAPSTEIPASFNKGTEVYTACTYEQKTPALLKVVKDPKAKWNPSICMGHTTCTGLNGLQGRGTAFCAANPDDSCPTAMECMTRRHDFFTGFNPDPRILSSRDAHTEMLAARDAVKIEISRLQKLDSGEAREALRKLQGQEAFYKLALENWISNQ